MWGGASPIELSSKLDQIWNPVQLTAQQYGSSIDVRPHSRVYQNVLVTILNQTNSRDKLILSVLCLFRSALNKLKLLNE